MFDWLFGDGGKGLEQQQKQLRESQYNQQYGRTMSSAMNDIFSDPANAELVAQAGADFSNNWNDQANSIRGEANRNQSSIDEMQKQYESAEKSNRHNYFGNGLLGALLNPIGQTATAVGDLVTGQYQANDRDVMSDIGAGAQTALSFLPFAGGLARAGGAVGKMGAGIGKAVNSVPGMAMTGAGFSAGEALRQGGSETDMGDLLGAAGTGAAFGAGIPLAGRAVGGMLRNRGSGILGRELAQSGVADDVAQQVMGSIPNRALYQTALRSFVPKSTVGKLAAGGGALYGASQLMGMGGGQQDPTQQLVAQFEQQYGYTPSEYELQMLMAGGN